ncbi:hypothetical protein N8997_03255 [Gammaproteobacteria bacterium]|nr:hypothetical protein [Gammaproteobacteria bacterium]
MEDKIIHGLNLDLSNIPASGETRNFIITTDKGSEFNLTVKDNTTGYYYNFVTNAFQATVSRLEVKTSNKSYSGSITFPAVTGADDQYDVYLYALPGTRHVDYAEVRFPDGTLDLNGSTGSNSLMIQKVIYQYAAIDLTFRANSLTSTTPGSTTSAEISNNIGRSKVKTAFSLTYTAATTAAYRILKQPTAGDIINWVQPTIGSAPIDLPGENIYPTARAVFTGDDVNGAVTSGAVVRLSNTDLSAVIEVGDKITADTTTDVLTEPGVGATIKLTDVECNDMMAVGDRITSSAGNLQIDNRVFLIKAINVGSDTAVFEIGDEGGSAADNAIVTELDGVSVIFSPKVNRSLTTVTVVETGGTATDFTMSQDIQLRHGATLTFAPRKNYSWPINNFAHVLKEDMVVIPNSPIGTGVTLRKYQDTVTIFEGTTQEETIIKNEVQAVNATGAATVTKGVVTAQAGSIVFSSQQVLTLASDAVSIGAYGETGISLLNGWDVKFSDLAIALTAPTTTTTEATSAHATIAVADREGVINNVSRVGGIGINPSVQNPLITSGGGADGAGDWVMDAVQTLENGATLTIENTGRVATITGNVEVVKAGTSTLNLYFDIEKLLSTSAPS